MGKIPTLAAARVAPLPVRCHTSLPEPSWEGTNAQSRREGPSLEYLQARLAVIVDEWRETPAPTDEQIKEGAGLVSELNIRIAAMEAVPAHR